MLGRFKITVLIFSLFMAIILTFSYKPAATYLFGEARWKYNKLQSSNIKVPTKRTIEWNTESEFADNLVHKKLVIKEISPKNQYKKSGSVKEILQQLLANENIDEANKIIQNWQPWGTSGSAWLLNPKGGYDFALTPLTTILFLFDDKPEILYPKTKKHLLNVLLINDGGNFSDAVPKTLGRVKDSENHVLMAQGSKYLKNQYLMLNGNIEDKFNNIKNGMESAILKLLMEYSEIGLYEYNSIPYSAYTITPLLNLEAFGSEKVSKAARDVLDYISFTYALGSYNFKHYPPFRRRLDRHKTTTLSEDYQTVFMKSWFSFHSEINYNKPVKNGKKHALMAVSLPYRPPNKTVELLFDKSSGYFVKLGHGTKSCPEIYSAGDGYLLSAGGATQGKWSIIVTRPICLFINDDADDISEVIHLKASGENFMKWNNTGVYKNFACTNGSIHIPEKFKPEAKNKIWTVYSVQKKINIAIHSSNELSVLSIFKYQDAKKLANKLIELNPDLAKLKTQFQFPTGKLVEYDINSPRNKWIITAVNGNKVDRDFYKWPLISGNLN